ncbi:hypothetical protein [Gardnerella vaginalis]|uniref:hypothetical protein n=1 Tax=Gardnerella vaginalis TaxID=2702 RepID=UPI001145B3E9|nr:hypothetical protein [Gardnerella vaginalis]
MQCCFDAIDAIFKSPATDESPSTAKSPEVLPYSPVNSRIATLLLRTTTTTTTTTTTFAS